jgi:predicted RNA-binding Zn-ribbon protein involved in translation (DUF1610 family)
MNLVPSTPGDTRPPPEDKPRLGVFLRRAIQLRCPECGVSPMFVPLARTRSLHDWYQPLDGCPRCGYAYEREPGYFLLAIWGSQYGVVAGFGVTLGLILLSAGLSLTKVLWFTCVPMFILAVAFIRHAKAIYLAVDHFIDPQRKPPASS